VLAGAALLAARQAHLAHPPELGEVFCRGRRRGGGEAEKG
jgi:hypothetical protein